MNFRINMKPVLLLVRRKVNYLSQCEKGLALIEFALALPFMLLLLFGVVELSRVLLITQKVDKTIILANNIVTQHLSPSSSTTNGIVPLSIAEMDNLMLWVPSMMSPTTPSFKTNGIIVITDVTTGAAANKPVINWQYCGGGTLAQKSKIGKAVIGKTPAATLPAGFTMNANEEVIIGEVYYKYVPLIPNIVPVTIPPFYRTSIFVPRYEALSSLVSANCP